MPPNDDGKPSGHFWTSLPGTITAVAALLTAIAGLLSVLYANDIIGGGSDAEKAVDSPAAPATAPLDPITQPPPGTVTNTDMLQLAYPTDRATLPQSYLRAWEFAWDAPPGAAPNTEYQIRVLGPSATRPTIDTVQTGTSHTADKRPCSYILDRNRRGWRWRVRARQRDSTWSQWSATRTFDVAPFDRAQFCERCPSARSC